MLLKNKIIIYIVTIAIFTSCISNDLSDSYSVSFFEIQRFIDYETIIQNNSSGVKNICEKYLEDSTLFKTSNSNITIKSSTYSSDGYTKQVDFYFKNGTIYKNDTLHGAFKLLTDQRALSSSGAKSSIKLNMFSINSYNAQKLKENSTRTKYPYFVNMEIIYDNQNPLSINSTGKLWINQIDTVEYESTYKLSIESELQTYTGSSNLKSQKFNNNCTVNFEEGLSMKISDRNFSTGLSTYSIDGSNIPVNYAVNEGDSTIEFSHLNITNQLNIVNTLSYQNGK
jgi:hypothetical protein